MLYFVISFFFIQSEFPVSLNICHYQFDWRWSRLPCDDFSVDVLLGLYWSPVDSRTRILCRNRGIMFMIYAQNWQFFDAHMIMELKEKFHVWWLY